MINAAVKIGFACALHISDSQLADNSVREYSVCPAQQIRHVGDHTAGGVTHAGIVQLFALRVAVIADSRLDGTVKAGIVSVPEKLKRCAEPHSIDDSVEVAPL